MTNHRFNKGIEEIQNATKMNVLEKVVLAGKLERYADHNPPLELKWPAILYRREFVYIIATLLVIVIGAGGTVAAAEGAVPGSFLYPIKLSINEPIRGIASGTMGKAGFYAWQTGRRLAEAETLALNGSLSGIAEDEVQYLLLKSTESFALLQQELVSQGSVKEADAAQSKFDAEIGAHSRIIEKVKNRTSDKAGNSQIDSIEQAIRKNIPSSKSAKRSAPASFMAAISESTSTSPDEVSNSGTTASTAQSSSSESNRANGDSENSSSRESEFTKRAHQKVEDLIDKARKDIEKNYSEASDIQKEILDDARSALESARESLDNSKTEDDAGRSDEADDSLKASIQSLKEADITVKQSSKLREGLRKNKDR